MNEIFFSICIYLTCSALLVVSYPTVKNMQDAIEKIRNDEAENEFRRFLEELEEDTNKNTIPKQTELSERESKRAPDHITYGTGVAHTPRSSTHKERDDASANLAEWERLFQLYYGNKNRKTSLQNDDHQGAKSDAKNESKRVFGEISTDWTRGQTPQRNARLSELEKRFKILLEKENKRSNSLMSNKILPLKRGKSSFGSGWAHGNIRPSNKNNVQEWHDLFNQLYGKRASFKRSEGRFGSGWGHSNVPSQSNNQISEWEKLFKQIYGKRSEVKRGDGIFSSGWAHGNIPSSEKNLDQWHKLFEQLYGKRFQLMRDGNVFSSGWAHGNVLPKKKDIDRWQKMFEEIYGRRSDPSVTENEVDLPSNLKRSGGTFTSGWAHGQKEKEEYIKKEWEKMYKALFAHRVGRSVE